MGDVLAESLPGEAGGRGIGGKGVIFNGEGLRSRATAGKGWMRRTKKNGVSPEMTK